MDEEVKLEMCPFCGSENIALGRTKLSLSVVKCRGCGARGKNCSTDEEAVDAWNYRHELHEVIAAYERELQRLKEILKTNNVEYENG